MLAICCLSTKPSKKRGWKSKISTLVFVVVILTISAEDSDIRKAYQFGVNSYIVKPMDFEKFIGVADQIGVYWCVTNTPPRLL